MLRWRRAESSRVYPRDITAKINRAKMNFRDEIHRQMCFSRRDLLAVLEFIPENGARGVPLTR